MQQDALMCIYSMSVCVRVFACLYVCVCGMEVEKVPNLNWTDE